VDQAGFLEMLRRRALTGSEQEPPMPAMPQAQPVLSAEMLNRIDAELLGRERAGMGIRPDLREMSDALSMSGPDVMRNMEALGANAWSLGTQKPGSLGDWEFDPDRTYGDVTSDMGLEGWRGVITQGMMMLAEPGFSELAVITPKLGRALTRAFGSFDPSGPIRWAPVTAEHAGLYRQAMASLDPGPKEFVTHYTTRELRDMIAAGDKVFMHPSGAGFMVKADGEFAGLFNAGTMRGIAPSAIEEAKKQGARHGFAFDVPKEISGVNLPELYGRHGFQVTDRMPFNEAYAPQGWMYDRYGRPDLVRIDLVLGR